MITIILVPPEPIIKNDTFTAPDPNNATIIITLTVSFCTSTIESCLSYCIMLIIQV